MNTLKILAIVLISANVATAAFARGGGGGMGQGSGQATKSHYQHENQYRNQNRQGTGQGTQTRTQTRDQAGNPTGETRDQGTRWAAGAGGDFATAGISHGVGPRAGAMRWRDD